MFDVVVVSILKLAEDDSINLLKGKVIYLVQDNIFFIYKINVQPVFHHEIYRGRFTILLCLNLLWLQS